MELVAIPQGRFIAGSDAPEGNDDERPRREAATGAYEIALHAVTNEEFEPFLEHGYRSRALWSDEGWEVLQRERWTAPRFRDDPAFRALADPRQPVAGVSFFEAEAFARWAGLRLPTELEWERAARGEDGRRYPWGDDWDPARAHHRGGARHPLPVGSFPSGRSPHGLFDCAGNVWEWCSDEYAPGLRAARGGSWNAHPPQLRCASRNAWPAAARFSNLGFRLAR